MPAHDERWKQLCERAAIEQDPDKLLKLVQEINELLDAKHDGTQGKPKSSREENRTPES